MTVKAGIRHFARGFLVARLQGALGVPVDGAFGNITCTALRAKQTFYGLEPDGIADELTHGKLGVPWPTELERCLAIVDGFEGTGFGGVNKHDIDGFGVTLGIVGFTSRNGEVQDLLREYYRTTPNMVNAIRATRRVHFMDLINNTNSQHQQWEQWFYGVDGVIDADIRATVAKWGQDPQFQQLQLNRVAKRYWARAIEDASKLKLTTMAGRGLMFDVAVQNGGWREEHQRLFNEASLDGTQANRMDAIARAVSACASLDFRGITLTRKLIFATGAGVFDGTKYELINYGFETEREK